MKPILSILFLTAGLIAADLDRGVELYNQGDFDKATDELQKVVEENPENSRARRYLGLALVERGLLDEAAVQLSRAHELEPSGETQLALARLAVDRKAYDEAETRLKEASGDDVGYVRGLLNYRRGKNQDAANDFEQYLKAKPDNAYAHYYAGLAYNGLRRPDKMMTHFEMFLRMKPDAPEAKKVRAVMKTGR